MGLILSQFIKIKCLFSPIIRLDNFEARRFTLIQKSGLREITQVRASGGGTKSALWRQILASILEAELVTVNTVEGAALLAGVGAGAWPNVPAACTAVVRVTDIISADKKNGDAYHRAYSLYRELYPALKPGLSGCQFEGGQLLAYCKPDTRDRLEVYRKSQGSEPGIVTALPPRYSQNNKFGSAILPLGCFH